MTFDGRPKNPLIKPIAEAAVATVYFEQARPFNGRSKICLSDAILRHAKGLSFRALGVTTTVKNYTLADVVLDGKTLILFQDGRPIPETAYFVPPQDELTTIARGAPVRLDGNEDIIICFNNAHAGYQHWLTQCLPAIDWSMRRQRTRKVRLVLPKLESWQEDFIRILGYDTVARLTPTPSAHYLLLRTEFSEFLNGSTSFGICLSALETARRILNASPPFPSPHKLLYVPCANPYYGSIRNEAEIADLLRRNGFHVVDQTRLFTADRINLFRHADAVIGPLGQGLADILFCRPGALLWEWMPAHHQNASFNRLAQAAEVDYWGDQFESVVEREITGQWHIDVAVVSRRLADLSIRLAIRGGDGTHPAVRSNGESQEDSSAKHAAGLPLDELMIAFESLGDNCEFGLVQRSCGAEPVGLFRFASIFLPIEIRVSKLVAALGRKLEGLGAAGTLTVYADGEAGRREFLVREAVYNLMYHTGILEGEIQAAELQERETKRLGFLRRKLLEDLEVGAKIWVWKSLATYRPDQVHPLVDVLRSMGPNILLWVVEADEAHPAGTIERLDRDFIKGYIERFAPYDNAPDIRPASWFEVCQRTYDLCRLSEVRPQVPQTTMQPHRTPSAMEILAANPPTVQNTPTPAATIKRQFWLWKLFRFWGT